MKRKILLIFTVLILISVIITGIISLKFSRDEYMNELENSMISFAELIALDLENESDFDFSMEASNFSRAIDSRVTFIDQQGNVIGDSDIDISKLDNHATRPEVITAYQGEIGTNKRYSDTLKIDLYYLAYPFDYQNQKLIIRIAKPMYEIERFSEDLIKNYIIALIVGTLIALIFGLKFENYIVGPINELITATKRIAKGNFGEKIYVDSNDEIRDLAKQFNIMSEELEHKINEIKAVNLKLQSTLDSMVNGVVAVDGDKQILFINPRAEEIFKMSEGMSIGKKLIEVFKNHEVYELIEEYFSNISSIHIDKEIFYNNHDYLVSINPMHLGIEPSKKSGAVILIQDISEIKRLENMRQDFVANVSHELKTPLTSIRGFIETIRSGNIKDESTRDRFLEIIDIESSRLNHLIDDILLLSEIEKVKLNRSDEILIKESIDDVIQMMNVTAIDAGVELICKNEISDEMVIAGHTSWFKQLLINLIDNGIKYNKNNGKLILEAKHDNESLLLTIEDTGVGILEEHRDRIFERFYRVDKSRSKQVGGTGLGLAIVKHVIKDLRGTIRLESTYGKGTKFLIEIPIKKNI